MKKLLVLVFAIALCLGVLCVGASADDHIIRSEPSEGDGSPGSPYKIDTVGTLYWFADYVNDGHPNVCAVLTANIFINVNVLLSNGTLNDVPPNEWIPINNFSGTFNGNGKTIYGLYLSDTSDGNSSAPGGYYYTGMFRDVSGTVKNLKLEDSYVAGEFTKSGEITNKCNSVIGGICGVARAGATVSGCSFDGSLSAVTAQRTNLLLAGGICGYNMGQLENCSFDGTLTAANNSSRVEVAILSCGGGICGTNTGTVKDCTNRGTIKGEGYNPVAGGICGEGSSNTGEGTGTTSLIENCDNYGQVTAITEGGDGNSCYAGGILGYGSGEIIDCKNNAEVLGANYAGGIAGAITNGEITGCTNTEKVEGYYQYVGGICGYVSSSVTIKECTNSENIKLTDTSYGRATGLGGICGGMSDEGITIMNCHNTGNLTGHQDNPDTMYIGGICGRLSSGTNLDVYILNCCNTGIITSSSPQGGNVYTGGVCGMLVDGVKFENCLWLDLDGSGDKDTGAMTAERFARGEAAGLLNRWSNEGYTGKVWRLGEDGYPVLTDDDNSVVEVKFQDLLTDEVLMTCYTNLNQTLKGIDSIVFDEGTTLKIGDNEVDDLQSMTFGNDTTIVVDGGLRYALTATVTGSTSKEYDGTNTVKKTDGLAMQLSGIMTGDDVSASVQYIFDSADAGTEKTITAKSVTLNGKDAGKYVLDVANVSCSGVTGNIVRKELTASISGSVTKVYDGNTYVPDGLSITLEGVIPGDKDNVTATATYTFDSADAGEGKTINASDITLSGEKAGNYKLRNTTATGDVGTITAKTVTIIADDKTAKRGEDMPVLTYTANGFIGGDTMTPEPELSCDADMTVAGTYEIIVSGGSSSSNYTLAYQKGTLIVNNRWLVTVKYENGDADVSSYVEPGSSFKLPAAPSKSGYTFVGWSDGSKTYEPGDSVPITGNVTFTAVWKQLFTVTVAYDNGTAEKTEQVVDGDTFTLPAAPGKSGYTFLHWSDGTNTYDPGDSVPITDNATFIAVWQAINIPDPNAIAVTQPANGTVKVNPSNGSITTLITVTATPDEGYELAYITVDGEKISGNTFRMPDKAVTVSAVFVPVTFPFTDVKSGDWFYDYVAYVYSNGLMDGTSATTFEPNANMTRAMVWAILARIDGETVTGADWANTARAWAMAEGVSDGTDANGLVTREQFATMLYRYAAAKGYDVSIGESTNILSYADYDEISEWAIPAMQWACGSGIITGVTESTLVPKGTATRAQCAAMLMRFVEL